MKGSGALMGAFPHTGQVMQRHEVGELFYPAFGRHRTTSLLEGKMQAVVNLRVSSFRVLK